MSVYAAYTFLFVRDMTRAVAFYRDALGLAVTMATPAWSELSIEGATIALHSGRDAGTRETGLGFKVSNIDAMVNAVVAHGGFIHAPKSKAQGEPAIVKAGDTEGNVFFLSEGPGT